MANLLATLVELVERRTGDAIISFRLLFWWKHTKSGVVVDGERWLYGGYEHWALDTGMTADQVKHGLNRLREAGLIETKFMKRGPGRMLHIRVLSRLIKLKLADEGEPAITPAQTAITPAQTAITPAQTAITPAQTAIAPVHIEEQGETHGGTQGETAPDTDVIGSYEPGTVSKVHEEENMGSAKELLKSLSKDQPVSSEKPAVLWCQIVSEKTGGFVALSTQDTNALWGMLKKVPKDKVADFLKFILTRWDDFVIKVQSDVGAEPIASGPFKGTQPSKPWTPLKPNVGYLSKYAEAAIGFWHDTTAQPQTPAKAPKPVAVVHPQVQSIAQDEEDTPITSLAELEAIFSGKPGA